MTPRVVVMGSFVADLAFRTPRLPRWGETVMGSAFRLGPGVRAPIKRSLQPDSTATSSS